MESSATSTIAESLTRAIVEHKLLPGTKLGEQKLADHFGVSRTLVRQALFQLSQNRLVTLEPARGAFVSTPSVEEAKQVFAVRLMLETAMTRTFVQQVTPAQIKALKQHITAEKKAMDRNDVGQRTELLGDFHVLMAELLGNHVLADVLQDLLARCAIATLMYQSSHAAHDSSAEHAALVECFAAGNVTRAVKLMREHLDHVEAGLKLDQPVPSHDVKSALAPV